MFDTNALRA